MVERATPMAAKDKLAALLRAADIEIDGSDPWDLRVLDERFYARVLAHGTLGAGESYMDGWWEVARLDEFFARVHQARLDRELRTAGVLAQVALSRIRNLQGRNLSTRVARRHYDLSHDLYAAMLAFLRENGWERLNPGEDWFENPGRRDTKTLTEAVDVELYRQGVDTRKEPE